MTGMFVKIVTSYIAQENNRKDDSKEEIKAQKWDYGYRFKCIGNRNNMNRLKPLV